MRRFLITLALLFTATLAQAAGFHSHRVRTVLSLVGSVRCRRTYYLCRACG